MTVQVLLSGVYLLLKILKGIMRCILFQGVMTPFWSTNRVIRLILFSSLLTILL